jgi:hypothetical protein
MKKKIKCISNFLDKESFKELQNLITGEDFPWFQRKKMVSTSTNDMGYFTHSFYNNNQINSNHYYYQYIKPILSQLDCKAVIQVRANLIPSAFYKEDSCAFHKDYEYESTTAILYLNTCDGGTEFQLTKKKIQFAFVEAEENKIAIFDADTQHRGTKSYNSDFRYILNFNYF